MTIPDNEQIRILHLGLGRFHRAHQAAYFQNLAELHSESWPIAAFSMRTNEASEQLRNVNFVYPVVVLDKSFSKSQNIQMIRQSYFIQTDRLEYLKLIALSHVQIVSLTITEKGYCLNSEGRLDASLVASDQKKFESCSSAIGFLYYGLRHRRLSGGYPLTILSCDNLRDNGRKLKNAILDYALIMQDAETADWMNRQVSFPNTMVDRIVPQLNDEKILDLQKEFNTINSEVVATEAFTQWVIEDRFNTTKPSLEKVGVQFVENVAEYEDVKLRVLNAAHSLLAYAGLLKGHSFVHEAINDLEIRTAVENLWSEVSALVRIPKSYTAQLLQRFDNPRLPHSLKQIAMDGSQKLPQRILPNLNGACLADLPATEHVLNCWAEYCYLNDADDPQRELIGQLRTQSVHADDFKNQLLKKVLNLS